MVGPVWILIASLGIAFLLTFLEKWNKLISRAFFYLTLIFNFIVSSYWFYQLLSGYEEIKIYTAGFRPPFSIDLQMGLEESFLMVAANFIFLFGAIHLWQKIVQLKAYFFSLYLALVLGINGLVMTRDLFNLFVFLEITSIAIYALIILKNEAKTISAGFKYIIAGGLASVLFLIGTIYIYRATGTLNIDIIVESKYALYSGIGFLSTFILLTAVLIELKSFPANGWALDVYQSTDPTLAGIIASVYSGTIFFVLYKILPFLDFGLLPFIASIGMMTFVFSNLIAIKQNAAQRLLGYSSVGQLGLLVSVFAIVMMFGESEVIARSLVLIITGLFLNHFLAKAGLFWLAAQIEGKDLKAWSILKGNSLLLLFFASFVFALIGLPPFPGFWAKWNLFLLLAKSDHALWLIPIIIGSLLEVFYLFRWFGIILKAKSENAELNLFSRTISLTFIFVALICSGFILATATPGYNSFYLFPLLFAAFIYLFNWLSHKFKGILAIFLLMVYSYIVIPDLVGIKLIFSVMFLGGGIIQLIATLAKEKSRGFYPFMLLFLISMTNLVISQTTIQFFLSWEMMSIAAYLLIIRGRKAEKPALIYFLFSFLGALAILCGFAFAYGEFGILNIEDLHLLKTGSLLIPLLFIFGFLIKSAAAGLHIWLPGSYAEAEDTVSPFLSSLFSKTGIYAFLLLLGYTGTLFIGKISVPAILGWIGVFTAFIGALIAIFQEDIKRMLAYSSVSQIGYIILTLSVMSHLGWVAAIYHSVNHFLFKGILFIAIAGVISRVGTRKMYKMGGLIKKMPLSFTAVLISIIAVSGVPPLSGFGGKWLMYTALLEKGWYLQTGLAIFAGAISFLYLFRLIHSIFLGQEKPKFSRIKEASAFYIVPQYLLIMLIMAISMYPNLIIKPIIEGVSPHFATTVDWNGYKVISTLGYWNGNLVMMITMVIFMVVLIWLLLRVRTVQKVKQFNIVFAAERPDRPETTHFAHNFFAHYQKALGFLVKSQVTRFWKAVLDIFRSLAAAFRHIYTGNGQTYALYIIMFLVISYLIVR